MFTSVAFVKYSIVFIALFFIPSSSQTVQPNEEHILQFEVIRIVDPADESNNLVFTKEHYTIKIGGNGVLSSSYNKPSDQHYTTFSGVSNGNVEVNFSGKKINDQHDYSGYHSKYTVPVKDWESNGFRKMVIELAKNKICYTLKNGERKSNGIRGQYPD